MFGSAVCVKHLSLVLLLVAGTALPAEHEKSPVPDEAARAKAWATIQDVFGSDTSAAELLRNAENVRKDPAAYWVLLGTAGKKAADEGNIELAMQAVDRIADTFDLDRAGLRLNQIHRLRGTAREEGWQQKLTEVALSVAKDAVDPEDFPQASEAGRLALELARRSRDTELIKHVVEVTKDVGEQQEVFQAFQRVQAILESDPTNPAANRVAGRYLCINRGDWDQGVPMLALCDDPKLKEAAVEELQVKETPQAWIALADTWWALEEEPFKLRAATWYKKALDDPRTTGLAAVKAERRWKEAQEVGKPIPEAPKSRPPSQDDQVRQFLMAGGVWQIRWSDGIVAPVAFMPDGTRLRVTTKHPRDESRNQRGTAAPWKPVPP
jgi:hypothetical protein